MLQKNFPKTRQFSNVKKLHNPPYVDIISGGFPCPAFSSAGKKGGFEQDNLFFQMLRICRKVKPKFILFENVEGFTNSKKPWKETLHKEIENLGYEWCDAILDARDFGIAQCRRRYFAICVRKELLPDFSQVNVRPKETPSVPKVQSHAHHFERTSANEVKEQWRAIFSNSRRVRETDGVSTRLDKRKRKSRLNGCGNAVVPQVAHALFKAIKGFYKSIRVA